MQTRSNFTRGKESGHRGHLRVTVDPHSSHYIVRSRPYFHWLPGDVDVGELLELVIHARKFLLDVFFGV